MNAKRPGIPEDASKIPPAINNADGKQVHDNMAPFRPTPVTNASDGGSHMHHQGVAYLKDEENGTGRT